MAQARAAAALGAVAGLLLSLPACVSGAEAPAKAKSAPPAQPQLSPEDQAVRDLLERFRAESKVKQEERRHLAEQHFKTGRAHFDLGAWRPALEHFKKAAELDPTRADAQDYAKRAAGLLGLKEGRGGPFDEVIAIQSVALQAQEMELLTLFAQAKAAFDKGQLAEALELFIRVKARAQYLAPRLDTRKIGEDAEAYIGKTNAAIEQRRRQGEKERLRRAIEEAEKLRGKGQSLLMERTRAQLAQAQSLFDERRYEQARKLCEEVLRREPTNAQAAALREGAADAARSEAIARVLSSRDAEMRAWLDEMIAMTVPQNDIIAISPERLEELRRRKSEPLFVDEQRGPEPWEGRTREALERKVTFDFIETPLPDVVSFLGSVADLNIVLDAEAAKGAAPTVTLRVQDMRLASALNWICKLVGYSYTLRDEALFLSKPERIPEKTVLRMYDITDLTIEVKNFKGRQRALATDTGFGEKGGGNLMDFFEDEKDEADKPLSGNQLIEFIRQVVRPGAWAADEELERVRQLAGLPAERKPGQAEELVDMVSIVVGGRTFLALRTRE